MDERPYPYSIIDADFEHVIEATGTQNAQIIASPISSACNLKSWVVALQKWRDVTQQLHENLAVAFKAYNKAPRLSHIENGWAPAIRVQVALNDLRPPTR